MQVNICHMFDSLQNSFHLRHPYTNTHNLGNDKLSY